MIIEESGDEFVNICQNCLNNDDLVNEFCRLKN